MISATHDKEPADIATSSSDYARRFSGAIGEWLIKVQNDCVMKLVPQCRGEQALDVGGGHGQLIAPLTHLGYKVVVLGSDERCMEQIQSSLSTELCSFLQGSLTQIPVSPKSYEVVTCIRFIAHCEEWRILIDELCRVSKHYVLLDYPPLLSGNIFTPITFRVKKMIEGNTRPYAIYSHREIEEQFKINGFKLVRRTGLFLWPMGIHRLLKSPKIAHILEWIGDILKLRAFFGSPTIAIFERH